MSTIPVGYKQTEIGMIPEDWEVKQLVEIFDITAGGDLRKDEFSDVFDDKYPYPIYSNAHTNHGLYGYCKTFDYEGEALTITARGGIGYTVVRDHSFSAIGRLLILKPHKGVQCKYVAEFINLKIEFVSESTGVPQLTAPQVSKYKIHLPSEVEQTTIATALSDTDALIESLEKLIAKKRHIKQGAMQELLTPKEGWEVKKLGKICDYQNGTSLEQYFNNEYGLEVISIGNYSPSGKFVVTNTFINRSFENLVKKFILKKNELTMILNDKTAVGSIIGRVLLIDEDNKYVFNQRTMRLMPKAGYCPLFLYYKLNSDEIHNKIILASKPGTQIYVNTNDITDLELVIPALEEQTAIATILSDMDAEITALEERLDKTRTLKSGMMHELLTGRIRLI